MALCPKCGVNIGDEKNCPLCGIPIDIPFTADSDFLPLNPKEIHVKQIYAIEIISVLMSLISLTLIVADFSLHAALTWSVYPLSALVFAWLVVCIPIFFRRKPLVIILLMAVVPFPFLFLLAFFSGNIESFYALSLPITFGAEVFLGSAALLTFFSKRRGFNIIGYTLIAATAICMSTEACIDTYFNHSIYLGWSTVVAFALIPISGFLIYFHYRISKRTTLKKIFHL